MVECQMSQYAGLRDVSFFICVGGCNFPAELV